MFTRARYWTLSASVLTPLSLCCHLSALCSPKSFLPFRCIVTPTSASRERNPVITAATSLYLTNPVVLPGRDSQGARAADNAVGDSTKKVAPVGAAVAPRQERASESTHRQLRQIRGADDRSNSHSGRLYSMQNCRSLQADHPPPGPNLNQTNLPPPPTVFPCNSF